jgi:hypothetical protein
MAELPQSSSRLLIANTANFLYLFAAEMVKQGRKGNVKEPGYAVRKVSTKRRHPTAPV